MYINYTRVCDCTYSRSLHASEIKKNLGLHEINPGSIALNLQSGCFLIN